MLAEKSCTRCGETKPAAAFQRRPSAKSGLASWCRRCRQAHSNGVYAPAKRRERKQQIISLKGGACRRCGGVFPHYVYDLHHRDPAEKEIGMTDLQDKAWARVEAELEKCDLLCANCHRIAHHEHKPDRPLPSGGNAAKVVCNAGHPLSGENLYLHGGRRHCRACNRARVSEYAVRQAAGAPA